MYGKITYKGQEIHACCTRQNLVDAYIMCRLFPAAICKNCGEVTGVFGAVREWIFRFFFAPFWDGQVLIPKELMSDDELERIERFNNG